MATALENLIAARDDITAAIAANAGKPSYSIDGQSVSYSDLMGQLRDLNAQIAACGGPYNVSTEMST